MSGAERERSAAVSRQTQGTWKSQRDQAPALRLKRADFHENAAVARHHGLPNRRRGYPWIEAFHPRFARFFMPKVLVDCGNCGPDFNAIRQMVSSQFNATVLQTHGAEDTLESACRQRKVDLVTVNRKLDRDYSDGLDVVKQIKADPGCRRMFR